MHMAQLLPMVQPLPRHSMKWNKDFHYGLGNHYTAHGSYQQNYNATSEKKEIV
jgi:hypothetical protein